MKSLDDVCLSYDHGFGLRSEAEKNQLREEAREWIIAFHLEDHDIEVVSLEHGLIENKLWPFILSANKILKRKYSNKAADGWCNDLMAYMGTINLKEDN